MACVTFGIFLHRGEPELSLDPRARVPATVVNQLKMFPQKKLPPMLTHIMEAVPPRFW